jgi:hypothetical protein
MNLRKIVFAAAVVACLSVAANAGIYPHAIGLRFGGGWGGELNYQMGMGEANRLEIGLGFSSYHDNSRYYGYPYNRNYWTNHTSFGVYGAYQWYWNISPSFARGGFNWYVGPGAGVGFWSNTTEYPDHSDDNNSGINIGVGGQIGIEYDFNVLGAPLVLDIDYRPTIIGLSNNGIGIGHPGSDFALGFRYTF